MPAIFSESLDTGSRSYFIISFAIRDNDKDLFAVGFYRYLFNFGQCVRIGVVATWLANQAIAIIPLFVAQAGAEWLGAVDLVVKGLDSGADV